MVDFHEDCAAEVRALQAPVRVALVAALERVREKGPALGRPRVDTLIGSRHANLKELRFNALDQPWRFAFAFDPSRRAIVLVGGAKAGVDQRLFYRRLLEIADRRYDQHLASLSKRLRP